MTTGTPSAAHAAEEVPFLCPDPGAPGQGAFPSSRIRSFSDTP